MARFCPLYSGSSGNSIYLSSGNSALLVDIGVSCKALTTAMAQRDFDVGGLQGILITHEHSDHIQGLRVFLKKYPLPVYGSPETLEYLMAYDKVPAQANLIPIQAQQPFEVGELVVTAFDTPHDSVHSLGYCIQTTDGRRVGIATDLGHYAQQVRSQLLGCDLVMLESNYEETMLLACPTYPYLLKQRIRSPQGHLSNLECSKAALELVQHGTTRLLLGHLSKETNTESNAYQTTVGQLTQGGITLGRDVLVGVAKRENANGVVTF